MRFGISVVATTVVLFLTVSGAFSQMVAPYRGGKAPEHTIFDRYTKNRLLQKNRAAWVGKAERASRNRQEFLASTNQQSISLPALPDDVRYSIAIAGTLWVPVIPVKYSDTGADPFTETAIQDRLFDNSSGTVTEYYDEVSYGNLHVTGAVYDWVSLSQTGNYYEGGPGCRGVCTVAKTGELILDALIARDAAINFGDYDNDGPDGVPNSGDDDGLVDFVAFTQPETGGECGNSNIISHHFVVGGWPEFGGTVDNLGSPWQTNDARFGGGMIEIWEYSMHPAMGDTDGCGSGLTEIGVYCHEFGHAFGLPDLYDTSNASFGIGHWGIMGIGNENTPSNPANMCAMRRCWRHLITARPVPRFRRHPTFETALLAMFWMKLGLKRRRRPTGSNGRPPFLVFADRAGAGSALGILSQLSDDLANRKFCPSALRATAPLGQDPFLDRWHRPGGTYRGR